MKKEKIKVVVLEDELEDANLYEFPKECHSTLVYRNGMVGAVKHLLKDERGTYKKKYPNVFKFNEIIHLEEEYEKIPKDAKAYFIDGLNGHWSFFIEVFKIPKERVYITSGDWSIVREAEEQGYKIGNRGKISLKDILKEKE